MCDTHEECVNNYLDESTPICCVAALGCWKTPQIISTIDNSDSVIKNVSIRCDAWYSCIPVNDAGRTRRANGHIYMTGAYANAGNTENGTTHSGTIETTNKNFYDVFCSGYSSCSYQSINNVNNLYCTSHKSCIGSPGLTNINNLYSYATNSAYGSIISNVGNVYCSAYQSCFNTDISNVDGNVYGSGYKILSQSTISNVGNNVIGMGYQALYESEISNVANVCFFHSFIVFYFLYKVVS